MTPSHSQKLDRMIQYGIITTPENVHTAHVLLNHVSPDTMTQEDVARRWPRIVASLICESLGYFTPRSAANAVLAFRLGRPFGCEYYCFSAGFETDGWPRDPAVYDSKLKDVGKRKIVRATQCSRIESVYDACATCNTVRYIHPAGANPTYDHTFVEKPLEHHGCRHGNTGYMRDFQYALKLVREMAGGAAHPLSLLASWF